ncbi:MAG: hypothetical protein ABDH91_08920 [Bacteroidia bacterium]
MASAKDTERTFQGELYKLLSEIIEEKKYPFQVRQEQKYGDYTPDLSLYPKEGTRPFAIWELKQPGLKEDLSRLPDAAASAGASYALTSNVRETILYRIYRRQPMHLKTLRGIPVADLKTLLSSPEHMEMLKRHAEEVLKELNLLLDKDSDAPSS